MITRYFVTFIIMIIALERPLSQVAKIKPEVGKECPDFELLDVTGYDKTEVTLNDFKGKWLFLDFWFTGCTSCIKSFPKVHQFQKDFKDKVQFLLVGMNDRKHNSNIKEVFDKLTKQQGLLLAAAFDSVLVERWGISSMPHIVIINPEGIVMHITGGRDMTSSKIQDLIDGKEVSFYPKDVEYIAFDADKLTTVSENVNEKLIYRSILTEWNGEPQNGGYSIDDYVLNYPKNIAVLKKGWSVAMIPLYGLYNYAYIGRWTWTWRNVAYYGKYYHWPILEVADSSLFDFDYRFDVGKGTYNYNLTVPPELVTKEYVMREIQKDLHSVFGYEVSVETRKMPVWRLVAAPGTETRLRTKGGKPDSGVGTAQTGHKSPASGFVLKNQPVSRLLHLSTYIIQETDLTPFIDATNILTNIDITIDADLTDFSKILKALRANGLDFVKDTSDMKVVVIRDPTL